MCYNGRRQAQQEHFNLNFCSGGCTSNDRQQRSLELVSALTGAIEMIRRLIYLYKRQVDKQLITVANTENTAQTVDGHGVMLRLLYL